MARASRNAILGSLRSNRASTKLWLSSAVPYPVTATSYAGPDRQEFLLAPDRGCPPPKVALDAAHVVLCGGVFSDFEKLVTALLSKGGER